MSVDGCTRAGNCPAPVQSFDAIHDAGNILGHGQIAAAHFSQGTSTTAWETKRLWIITAEILVKPGDLPSGDEPGTFFPRSPDCAELGPQSNASVLRQLQVQGVEVMIASREMKNERAPVRNVLEAAPQNVAIEQGIADLKRIQRTTAKRHLMNGLTLLQDVL